MVASFSAMTTSCGLASPFLRKIGQGQQQRDAAARPGREAVGGVGGL